MDLKLNDKVALIVGSSRGLGFATAKIHLAEGAKIIINGRTENSSFPAIRFQTNGLSNTERMRTL